MVPDRFVRTQAKDVQAKELEHSDAQGGYIQPASLCYCGFIYIPTHIIKQDMVVRSVG